MLHYVGVLPAHRGKRLGFWVSVAALHRMRADERDRAWLATDDIRLPAVKTYLDLGFEPLLVHENQRERWVRVFVAIGRPELRERFNPILSGPVWRTPVPPPDRRSSVGTAHEWSKSI